MRTRRDEPLLKRIGHGISRIVPGIMLSAALAAPAIAQTFTNIGAGLPGVHHGSAIWADHDNDGDLDLFLYGEQTNPTGYAMDVFANSSGSFSALGAAFDVLNPGTYRTRGAWGDYDGDNQVDLAVTGPPTMGYATTDLYHTAGGSYSMQGYYGAAPASVILGSVAWGDYDNDGDLDLFISGRTIIGSTATPVTTIFRNDGVWGTYFHTFTNIQPAFKAAQMGEGAWADYDNDGDIDIAITGTVSNLSSPSTTLYRNDGGAFVPSGITFPATVLGSLAWFDYDNDGFIDLALGGGDASNVPTLRVFHNAGGTTFTTAATLPGVRNGSVAWADYNNDGFADLLVSGLDSPPAFTDNAVTKVYRGNGAGTFTVDANAGLSGIEEGQAGWGDFDKDGLIDILAAGYETGTSTATSKIYRNVCGASANTVPTAPTGLTISATWKSVTATWDASSDVQTPADGLTYNMRVYDQTTGTLVMTPMADAATGYRRVPAIGNVNHNRTWTVTGLAPGHTYEVCVQAIDGALAGSTFTCATATTPTTGPDVMIADCISDVGNEPDNNCAIRCYSPWIYIRNAADGLLPGNDRDQTPIGGQPNWVYVKLKNIGTAPLASGRVYVYWSKAGTNTSWQINWINYSVGGVLHGDVVGSAPVTSLGVGSTTIVEIPWANVPTPGSFNDPGARHFCLVARFISDADPMHAAEVASIATNTWNNNNVAWKNVTIYRKNDPDVPLDVANPGFGSLPSRLTFTPGDGEGEVPLTDYVQVKVNLGPEIYNAWNENGRQGTGVEAYSEEPGNTWIKVLAPDASIEGFDLAPESVQTIHVQFIYPDPVPQDVPDTYHWFVHQYSIEENGDPVYLGGEAYEVVMRETPPELPKRAPATAASLAASLNLTAHPNPSRGTTTIDYTLPHATAVTVTIHDAAGRLARTLASGVEQSAGMHVMTWDGSTADGTPVPAGTYLLRLETGDTRSEKQIRIVR